MITIRRFTNGESATAENFNLPLADCDTNFDECDSRLDAIESGAHDPVSVADPIALDGQSLSFKYSSDFDLNESGQLISTYTPPAAGPSLPKGWDSICVTWKDNATITLKAGGQVLSADSVVVYEIEADQDVGFANNLSYGESESANSKWYIWTGQASNGDMMFVLSQSSATTPKQHGVNADLIHPVRLKGCLRNNASSNLINFHWDSNYQYYDVDISLGGSDTTEVLDQTSNGAFVDVDCSGFVPSGDRIVHVVGLAYIPYIRKKGDVSTNGIRINTQNTYINFSEHVPVNGSGVFELRDTAGNPRRVSLWGFSL